MATKKRSSSGSSYNSYKSRTRSSRSRSTSSNPFSRRFITNALAVVFIVVFAAVGVHLYQTSHASTGELKSGLDGPLCLNLFSNNRWGGQPINSTKCDGRDAEHWRFSDGKIRLGDSWCAQVDNSGYKPGTKIVLQPCTSDRTGEVYYTSHWDSDGFYSFVNKRASDLMNQAMCLTIPSGQSETQLELHECNWKYNDQEWKEKSYDPGGSGCGDWDTAGPTNAKCIAQQAMRQRYGWGWNQYQCLVDLWNRESGWNRRIQNPSSGAFGIAQALGHGVSGARAYNSVIEYPGGGSGSGYVNEYPTYNANHESAQYQIYWGLSYIRHDNNFSTPCGAWGFEQNNGWYTKIDGVTTPSTELTPLIPDTE